MDQRQEDISNIEWRCLRRRWNHSI